MGPLNGLIKPQQLPIKVQIKVQEPEPSGILLSSPSIQMEINPGIISSCVLSIVKNILECQLRNSFKYDFCV